MVLYFENPKNHVYSDAGGINMIFWIYCAPTRASVFWEFCVLGDIQFLGVILTILWLITRKILGTSVNKYILCHDVLCDIDTSFS